MGNPNLRLYYLVGGSLDGKTVHLLPEDGVPPRHLQVEQDGVLVLELNNREVRRTRHVLYLLFDLYAQVGEGELIYRYVYRSVAWSPMGEGFKMIYPTQVER